MTAPIGATVKLSYDADDDRAIDVGDALQTPSGRSYAVIGARRQVRGKHAGRWHLQCVVTEAIRPGSRVHPLVFYARSPRTRAAS